MPMQWFHFRCLECALEGVGYFPSGGQRNTHTNCGVHGPMETMVVDSSQAMIIYGRLAGTALTEIQGEHLSIQRLTDMEAALTQSQDLMPRWIVQPVPMSPEVSAALDRPVDVQRVSEYAVRNSGMRGMMFDLEVPPAEPQTFTIGALRRAHPDFIGREVTSPVPVPNWTATQQSAISITPEMINRVYEESLNAPISTPTTVRGGGNMLGFFENRYERYTRADIRLVDQTPPAAEAAALPEPIQVNPIFRR